MRDLREGYRRIDAASTVVSSPYGDIEFRQGGTGPAVLVIHGSGGGHDQGELIARAVRGGSCGKNRWLTTRSKTDARKRHFAPCARCSARSLKL